MRLVSEAMWLEGRRGGATYPAPPRLSHQAGMAAHLGRKLRCAAYVFCGV